MLQEEEAQHCAGLGLGCPGDWKEWSDNGYDPTGKTKSLGDCYCDEQSGRCGAGTIGQVYQKCGCGGVNATLTTPMTIKVAQYHLLDNACRGSVKGTYTGTAGRCNKFVFDHVTAYWSFTMQSCTDNGEVSVYLDERCRHPVQTYHWNASEYGKCVPSASGGAVTTCA